MTPNAADGSPVLDGALGRQEHLALSGLKPCSPSPTDVGVREQVEVILKGFIVDAINGDWDAAAKATAGEILALLNPPTARETMSERCIACAEVFVAGEGFLPEASGGFIHSDCCGPERESYYIDHGDGPEPLGPEDAIPSPLIWEDDDA